MLGLRIDFGDLQAPGDAAMNDYEQRAGDRTTDSGRSRRAPVPGSRKDGGLRWWGASFRDAAMERSFQYANMAATRQYLMLLAGAGLAGALLTAYAGWINLPADSAAFRFGTAWRFLLAAAAVGVMLFVRRVKHPWQLYACNAAVLSMGYLAIALRSSAPAGAEPEITVLHVTQNGLTLILIVSMAQLVLVPGWFTVNAAISAAALACALFVMLAWPDPPINPLDISSVAFVGFLFILGMGYSAQRMRRESFFARTRLQEANLQLNRLATMDHLTGCANRRHFYAQAEAELTRSRRYSRDLGLVIMDVDHFKAINDEYGHAAGDAALQTLTECIREGLRELDVLGRIGGEEFALLLPETSRGEAVTIAERMRHRVDDLRIEYDGHELGLTASFGVTSREAGDLRLDSIMRRADRALYEAKAAGRNRTAVADSERTASVAK